MSRDGLPDVSITVCGGDGALSLSIHVACEIGEGVAIEFMLGGCDCGDGVRSDARASSSGN